MSVPADRKEGGVGELKYPLVSDLKREISKKYNVLTEDGVALRGLFIVDKEVWLAVSRCAQHISVVCLPQVPQCVLINYYETQQACIQSLTSCLMRRE